jgi:hypothetical protein
LTSKSFDAKKGSLPRRYSNVISSPVRKIPENLKPFSELKLAKASLIITKRGRP